MIRSFHKVSNRCSEITTKQYSTSFASAIRLLHRDLRQPIYNIYGFVRFADEIVDTFHGFDKTTLLAGFKSETYDAIERKLSLNPILNSFQATVNQYAIDLHLVDAFFRSMEYDLHKSRYDRRHYDDYIYGSAESVGLMCLSVFCESDHNRLQELKPFAQALGAAFQKVNFLRDVKSDYELLERTYFPGVDFRNFTSTDKDAIEQEIRADFAKAYQGILRLPLKARFGVYVAYRYYLSLFNRITRTQAGKILYSRIRVPNHSKALILVRAGIRSRLNLI